MSGRGRRIARGGRTGGGARGGRRMTTMRGRGGGGRGRRMTGSRMRRGGGRHMAGRQMVGRQFGRRHPANFGFPYTFGYYYRPVSYDNWVVIGSALNLETGEVARVYGRQIDGGWWRYAIQTNYGRFTLLDSRNWNLEIGQMYYIQGETWRIIRL